MTPEQPYIGGIRGISGGQSRQLRGVVGGNGGIQEVHQCLIGQCDDCSEVGNLAVLLLICHCYSSPAMQHQLLRKEGLYTDCGEHMIGS